MAKFPSTYQMLARLGCMATDPVCTSLISLADAKRLINRHKSYGAPCLLGLLRGRVQLN